MRYDLSSLDLSLELHPDDLSRVLCHTVLNGRADGSIAFIEWTQTLRDIRALPETAS
jgi:hypothetical protein